MVQICSPAEKNNIQCHLKSYSGFLRCGLWPMAYLFISPSLERISHSAPSIPSAICFLFRPLSLTMEKLWPISLHFAFSLARQTIRDKDRPLLTMGLIEPVHLHARDHKDDWKEEQGNRRILEKTTREQRTIRKMT